MKSPSLRVGLIAVLAALVLVAGVAVAQDNPMAVDAPGVGVGVESTLANAIAGRVADGSGNGVAGVTVTATTTISATQYPIILLPGVMGTLLRNEPKSGAGCPGGGPERIWITWERLSALQPLYLNDQGNGAPNNCDNIQPDGRMNIRLDIPNFPDQDLKPYEQFVAAAVSARFTVLDYRGYDWRLTLDDAVAKLDTFIDANKGSGGKVFLVAHSMGGLLARAYVADQTRAGKVAGVVTVGTPYLGAPLMAHRMATGTLDGKIDWRINTDQSKEIIRRSPGIQQLLPSSAYFTGLSSGYYRSSAGAALDTYQKTADYFVAQNYVSGNTLDMAEGFHADLDGFGSNFYAQGRYAVLYTGDHETPSFVREKNVGLGGAFVSTSKNG